MENNSNSDLQSNNPPTLEQVIKQSTDTVTAEITEKVQKKRGRKPGSSNAKNMNSISTTSTVVKSEELVKIEKAQYKMGVQMAFGLFGQYMAKAFKYDGFNLSEEELAALGDSGAECAHHFMPAIHPKWVALGGFTMVAGGIYAMKVVQYNEFKDKQKPSLDDGVKKD